MRLGWARAAARARKSRCCSESLGQFCLSPANGIRPPLPRYTERKGAGLRTGSLREPVPSSWSRASLQGLLHPAVLCKEGWNARNPAGRLAKSPAARVRAPGVPQSSGSTCGCGPWDPRWAKSTSIPRRSSPQPKGSRTFSPSSSRPQLPGPRASAPRCAWTEPEARPLGSRARSRRGRSEKARRLGGGTLHFNSP